MADATMHINCFADEAMGELLRSLAPCGVRYTRRSAWHIWKPDFTVTAPADFMPTLRERVHAAMILDDIERRAW